MREDGTENGEVERGDIYLFNHGFCATTLRLLVMEWVIGK